MTLADIQRHLGVTADGKLGPVTLSAIGHAIGLGGITVTAQKPFDRMAFLARYVNKNAPAITRDDIEAAAARLNVSPKHIEAIRKVESAGASFDSAGRPTILFEPHIFHRRTAGRYSPAPYSYAVWRTRPYPSTMDGRWSQMADAAEKDEQAALESASWGLFQVMGFHWQALGYMSAQAFAECMARSEGEHLEALVRYIDKNGLARALRDCTAGDPESCRDFSRGYNGAGYEKNGYHKKLAEALP